jgi:hypothetical protein
MEIENIQPDEKQVNTLYRVTPLSKYFAMLLFVLLPFVGGWVGYISAPEKIIEVEKIIVKEIPTDTEVASGLEDLMIVQNNSVPLASFEDKEIGIGFNYPEAWGTITVSTEAGTCPPTYADDPCQLKILQVKIGTTSEIFFVAETTGHEKYPLGRGGFWGDLAGNIKSDYLDLCSSREFCDVVKNKSGITFARYHAHVSEMGEEETSSLSYEYKVYRHENPYYGLILSSARVKSAGADVEKLFEETIVSSFKFLNTESQI